MGEVFKPEDIIEGKKKPTDLSLWPSKITPTTLREVIQEVKLLKDEVAKIKQVLRENGIDIK